MADANCVDLWNVMAFESDEHEQQIRDACKRTGAEYVDSAVTPSFRYVLQAIKAQMADILALVPWIKHFYRSEIGNVECILMETPE